ncbi:50S ribosomal protein-like protein [Parasponia andersonii]|uniref:50S ribosomal protein-like protein n=1 Tax=Parasponia andersonii TaxID=3476 RepID=A0A2P5BWH3_PARAD|nr:50S ribosomal protein-like protein [Parasponia andersonii]
MATLQKFKLLATQCAVSGSPTRSPSASPVIHLRRRKTLRMLLSRPERRLPRREIAPEVPEIDGEDPPPKKSKEASARRKLKDLFVSSPPPLEDRISDKRGIDGGDEEEQRGLLPGTGSVSGGFGVGGSGFGSAARRRGIGSLRPVSAGFRYRLLRRAWRPVLVTIPE